MSHRKFSFEDIESLNPTSICHDRTAYSNNPIGYTMFAAQDNNPHALKLNLNPTWFEECLMKATGRMHEMAEGFWKL